MKKFIILVILVLFSVSMAHSQAALLVLLFGDKVASENLYFSLKLGGNFANLSGIEGTKMGVGFNFGLLVNIKLSEKFSLVPEFSPVSRKGVKDIPLLPTGDPNLDALLQNSSKTVRTLNYLDIPVVAKYNVDDRISIGAGPYLGILTDATDLYTSEVFDKEDLNFEDNIKSDLRSLDYGFVFEISYSVSNARGGKGLVVHARYQLGLADILRDNTGKAIKNSVFQVFVSFPFIKEAEE